MSFLAVHVDLLYMYRTIGLLKICILRCNHMNNPWLFFMTFTTKQYRASVEVEITDTLLMLFSWRIKYLKYHYKKYQLGCLFVTEHTSKEFRTKLVREKFISLRYTCKKLCIKYLVVFMFGAYCSAFCAGWSNCCNKPYFVLLPSLGIL